MAQGTRRPTLAIVTYYAVMISLSCYFAFAAVQGDYGLLQRVEIDAEIDALTAHHATLDREVSALKNLTQRLSDDHLDLDLLDERARAVLGMMRMDEIAIR